MRDTTVGSDDVVIVHDYLTQRGGAERVVLSLTEAFPGAPIHTSLFDPDGTFDEFAALDIRPSVLNRSATLRRNHRLALPVLAPTFEAMMVDAPLTVASSSGWAHGVRCTGRRLVYCYAPARWLYQSDAYLAEHRSATRMGLRALTSPLRRWDRRAANRADRYVTISTRSRDLIRAAYGIDAEVVHPPHGIDPAGPKQPIDGLEPGFYLCVSRLLPYKNVDLLLATFAERPQDRLIVVGQGPDEARLRSLATANCSLVGRVSDDELRWLYANAQALVAASYEDLGLTPIEAAALGTPSVVLRFGGYLDTVVDSETGAFFDEVDPAEVGRAIDRLLDNRPDAATLVRHTERFSAKVFEQRIREIADEMIAL